MKKLTLLGAVFASFCSLISILSHAALIDNGSGLIYDDVLDITWSQPGTTGREWDTANIWAAGLTLGGASGWRLPYVSVAAGVGPTNNPVDCSTASEEECRDNELQYMFYHNLNGTALQPILDSGDPNLALFPTLQSYRYWSGTYGDPEGELGYAYGVSFSGRAIGMAEPKSALNLAWAVHTGDIRPIPVPPAVWLFGSGLLGLISIARRRTTKGNKNISMPRNHDYSSTYRTSNPEDHQLKPLRH